MEKVCPLQIKVSILHIKTIFKVANFQFYSSWLGFLYILPTITFGFLKLLIILHLQPVYINNVDWVGALWRETNHFDTWQWG